MHIGFKQFDGSIELASLMLFSLVIARNSKVAASMWSSRVHSMSVGPNMSGIGLEKCLGVQRKNPASWHIGDRKFLGSMNFLISQPGCGVITEY